jgi:hypothetical protein
MSNLLQFPKKKTADENLDHFIDFVKRLTADDTPSEYAMEIKIGTLVVKAKVYDVMYEEQRFIHFTKNELMAASGLPSMMMLTREAALNELHIAANVDFRLWAKLSHAIEYYTTASRGKFEYNFRTKDHRVAQVVFKLVHPSNAV